MACGASSSPWTGRESASSRPAAQYLALLDPIRHYLVVVRSVFLEGTGWWALRQPIVALFIMGITAL